MKSSELRRKLAEAEAELGDVEVFSDSGKLSMVDSVEADDETVGHIYLG